jgi:hypothetical protein
VHIGSINGEWKSTVLDELMARYHCGQPLRGTYVSHKVTKVERVITERKTGEYCRARPDTGGARPGPMLERVAGPSSARVQAKNARRHLARSAN